MPTTRPNQQGILSIHHRREMNTWTHSEAGYPNPQTWPTIAQVTAAAIQWITDNPDAAIKGVTGHADRDLLRAAGIRYLDSRGNKRRGGKARQRQREKFDQIMAERRDRKS